MLTIEYTLIECWSTIEWYQLSHLSTNSYSDSEFSLPRLLYLPILLFNKILEPNATDQLNATTRTSHLYHPCPVSSHLHTVPPHREAAHFYARARRGSDGKQRHLLKAVEWFSKHDGMWLSYWQSPAPSWMSRLSFDWWRSSSHTLS